MATIITEFPPYSFLEDLPDVTIYGVTSEAYITVIFAGASLMSNIKMTPNAQDRITIYTKQIIRNMLSLARPDTVVLPSPILQVRVRINAETLSTECHVIPGGTDGNEVINKEWFSKNFLTWQPQIIITTPEQPQWLAYIPTDIYDATNLSSTLYTKDGRSFSKTIDAVSSSSASFYRQIKTDFASLWENVCSENDLDPVCYDVYGVGFNYGEQNSQNKLLLPQRYILRPERYNDMCFGFENTLGGFDTLILEGKQSYQPDGDVTTFKTHTTEKELINDYTSFWEANTGRIETEREANQFQDFFKSKNRYIFHQGIWHRIIVSEYKVKHSRGESNSYTFKYHLADKNESRYFERTELPEVELPTII